MQNVRQLRGMQRALLLPPHLDELALHKRPHARRLEMLVLPRTAPARNHLRPELERLARLEDARLLGCLVACRG